MLTADERRLIAAALDSPKPSPEAARLLASNAEAAALSDALRADRARLQALPTHAAPTELFAAIMAEVGKATPARRPVRRDAGWLPYAVAASLLVGAATLGWQLARPGAANAVAERTPAKPQPALVRPALPATPPAELDLDNPPIQPIVEPELAPSPRPSAETVARAPEPPVPAPVVSGAAVQGGGFSLADVQIRLPLLAPLAELDRPDALDRVRAEAASDVAYRVDLFARDPAALAERLQLAAKAVGLPVVADALTSEALRLKAPAGFAAYTDALSRDDVARLLAALAAAERNHRGDATAQAFPVRPADARDFRDGFGADAPFLRRAKGPAAGATTIDQVTTALKGGPGSKALLLLATPAGSKRSAATAPREVRDFFAAPRGAGVPLILTVRLTGA